MRLVVLGPLLAAACVVTAPTETTVQDEYFERLTALCGQGAFGGQLVSNDAVDAGFKTATMIMGPATCEAQTVRIPFAVDEDRSRTWVITRTASGLRLKHDHRHRDGSEDTLTQYGGDSLQGGSARRHEFPVDAETRALFVQEEIEVSNQNTWAVEIDPGELFAYEMSRPERLFRVEFDLRTPVEAPPPPWGVEPVE